MKIWIKIVLSLLLIFGMAFAQEQKLTYSKIRISVSDKSSLRALALKGVQFDHPVRVRGQAQNLVFTVIVNNIELDLIKESGLDYKILVPDVVQAYHARQAEQTYSFQRSSDLPAGFELGSMGGFYTYDEVVAELDSMHQSHPQITSAKQSIGKSIENRDLWMIKISDHADQDEDEPEVLYTALHHAREPAGMMALMYFMDYLLDRYGSDPEVTYLVDHRQMFFVPVVNPDGYVYNQQQEPNGGGQWRKNRRNNGNGWYGVDLNRNYGYQWGYDDYGSSPYPFSDTYRGTGPFSEPETQAIRDFVQSRHLALAINYHTYSDLLIYPWGYVDALTPDSLLYKTYATALTEVNRYNFGTGEETVNYSVNGDSDDWLYGEQETKAKVLAVTPEVGTDSDGFWPDQDRIVPLCQENLRANLNLAWLAGGRLTLENYRLIGDDNQNGFPDADETMRLVCRVKNIGQGEAPNVTLSLVSRDSYLEAEGSLHYAAIPAQAVLSDTFTVRVQSGAPDGHWGNLVLRMEQDGYAYEDTLQGFVIGTPSVIFQDDAENGIDQWNTGQGWGIVAADTEHCFTDSPDGKYAANADNALTMRTSVSLPTGNAAYLTYRAHWDVERPFDFFTVELSTDGTNWTTLQAKGMVDASGQGTQADGTFGYDGFSGYWHKEWIDISQYEGQNTVYVRFRLRSDGGNQRDGAYVDDVRILAYTKPSALPAAIVHGPESPVLTANYPNPFNLQTTIRFYLPFAGKAQLFVYDINGRLVRVLFDGQQDKGWHVARWNGKDNAGMVAGSGIYFVRLQTSQHRAQMRKIMLLK